MAITGIGSVTVALVAAAIMLPMFGQVLSSFLSPIASALGNWFALWMADMAIGLRLMLSSVAGIIFCLSLFGAGVGVGNWYFGPKEVKEAIAELHKNYIFQPRVAHKKYVTTWYDPWTWF